MYIVHKMKNKKLLFQISLCIKLLLWKWKHDIGEIIALLCYLRINFYQIRNVDCILQVSFLAIKLFFWKICEKIYLQQINVLLLLSLSFIIYLGSFQNGIFGRVIGKIFWRNLKDCRYWQYVVVNDMTNLFSYLKVGFIIIQLYTKILAVAKNVNTNLMRLWFMVIF